MSEHAVTAQNKPAAPIPSLTQPGLSKQTTSNISTPDLAGLHSSGEPLDAQTRSFMEVRFGHQFGQLPLHAPAHQRTQPKLTVNVPNDPLEHEADQTADQVMHSGNPAQTRGHDFSRIRIHKDASAAKSAEKIHALAYTVGQDIVFGAGQYAPETDTGRRLLAHELTHTIQQQSHLGIQRKEKPGAVIQEKKRIKKVIVKLNSDVVTFILDDDTPAYGKITYNGQPNPGIYHVQVSDGIYTGIPKTGKSQDGYVVKWIEPDNVEFNGDYDFIVEAVSATSSTSKGTGKETTDGDASPKQNPPKGQDAQPGAGSQTSEKTTKPAGSPDGIKDSKGAPADHHAQGPGATNQADFDSQFDALPEKVKNFLGNKLLFNPKDYEQLLRIAKMLAELSPDELDLFLTAAKNLTDDLDILEKSLKQFKEMDADDRALLKEWSTYDDESFKGLDEAKKRAWAEKLVSLQSKADIKKFLSSPGAWAKMLAEGVLPPVKTAAEALKDFKSALDSKKSLTEREAYLIGGLAKTAGGAAQVAAGISLLLIFVPGVNVAGLLLFGLGAGISSILLSLGEAKLHIDAAAEAPDLNNFKEHEAKAASAMTSSLVGVVVMVAMAILGGIGKTIGKKLAAKYKGLPEKEAGQTTANEVPANSVTPNENSTTPENPIATTDPGMPSLSDETSPINTLTDALTDEDIPTGETPATAALLDAASKDPAASALDALSDEDVPTGEAKIPAKDPALKALIDDDAPTPEPIDLLADPQKLKEYLLEEEKKFTKKEDGMDAFIEKLADAANNEAGKTNQPASDFLEMALKLKDSFTDPDLIAKAWLKLYKKYKSLTAIDLAELADWNSKLPAEEQPMNTVEWAAKKLIEELGGETHVVEVAKGNISSSDFVIKHVLTGKYLLDFNVVYDAMIPKHGVLPHLVQALIVDDIKSSLNGLNYKGVTQALGALESAYTGMGVKAYAKIFDAQDWSLSQPEIIWPAIEAYFGW